MFFEEQLGRTRRFAPTPLAYFCNLGYICHMPERMFVLAWALVALGAVLAYRLAVVLARRGTLEPGFLYAPQA